MLNGDMFAFADEDKAYETLTAIKEANARFDITTLEMCDICAVDISLELLPDPDDGWKRGTLSDVKIKQILDAYLICMPPTNIKEDKTMFKEGQIVIYQDEPDLYSIESVLEFPGRVVFYSIKKINSNERPEITTEEYLTLARNNKKEDDTMATTTNKSYDCTATPEELELEKAIKEARDEAEKKIMDIRVELSKTLTALRSKYEEQEAVKREERQAHAWKRRYDALLKEGFSIEQAWEMTMKSFEAA